MKIPFRQIQTFLKAPSPEARVILIYGPDRGLMRERSQMLGKTVVEDINDPFNAVTLSGSAPIDDPARLPDEALAQSMMGGARLIRIEDAGDKITPILKDYLQAPSAENLVIVEADNLGPRSPLRVLIEKADNAAALPCYVEDERDIAALIRDTLREDGYTAAPDAVQWLAGQIAGDRQRARMEIEKLITYMGEEKQIRLEDTQACCGSAGEGSIDDLIYAVAGRQTVQALMAYERLTEEGISVIAILRALQNHFRRLHFVRSKTESGEPPAQAMKALSPPVFFKRKEAFQTQAQQWPLARLESAFMRLSALEAQCKQTAMPPETLCAQAVLALGGASR